MELPELNTFSHWPSEADSLNTQQVVKLYEEGFAGALFSQEVFDDFNESMPNPDGEELFQSLGYDDSGKGKLILPYLEIEKAYPGSMPGPAQGRGDCVSHAQKNANLLTCCLESILGFPDEVTGLIEQVPEISSTGIKQGCFSSEALYWYRGHGGDGWYCDASGKVSTTKAGAVVRRNYPTIDIDLTKYSSSLAGKWGRRSPPDEITNAVDDNLFREATRVKTFDAIRDALHRGFGINSCGSEGFAKQRDDNGVANRRGSWAHAMAYIGCDDRPETHRAYGGPLILILNSWGPRWIKGPRKIMGTDLHIPEGAFWARWKDVSRRSNIAMSGLNGWERKGLPDLGTSEFL